MKNEETLSWTIKNDANAHLSSSTENLQHTGKKIYNNDVLKLTGTTNQNSIEGFYFGSDNSFVEFSSVITNNGRITQDNVKITNLANLTNENLIMAKIQNDGILSSSGLIKWVY